MTQAIVEKGTGKVIITGVDSLGGYPAKLYKLVALPENYDPTWVSHIYENGLWTPRAPEPSPTDLILQEIAAIKERLDVIQNRLDSAGL